MTDDDEDCCPTCDRDEVEPCDRCLVCIACCQCDADQIEADVALIEELCRR